MERHSSLYMPTQSKLIAIHIVLMNMKLFYFVTWSYKTTLIMMVHIQIFEAYIISDVAVWHQSSSSLLWLQDLTSDFGITDYVGFKNLEIGTLTFLPC